MHNLLHRLKPGVTQNTHLLSAALLWTTIGIVLTIRGCHWLIADSNAAYIVVGVVAGSLKSLFILDKTARKSIDRILLLDDGSCLGAVYSVRTWLLVLVMMLGGLALRHSSLPIVLVGSLYVAIGWALFFSSRLGWKTYMEKRKKTLR